MPRMWRECAWTGSRLPRATRWPILPPTMRPRDRRLLVVLAFAALLVLAVLVHHAGTEALLAAPLLALLAPLLAGRYLGEEHIGRLAAARAAAGHTVARARRTSAPLRVHPASSSPAAGACSPRRSPSGLRRSSRSSASAARRRPAARSRPATTRRRQCAA